MLSRSILSTLFFVFLPYEHSRLQGCTASKTFKVIWNAPSSRCNALHENLLLDKYGVKHNHNYSFIGQEITLLYESVLGFYPRIDEVTGALINGGIPQRANLTAHLLQVQADLQRHMDPNYSGLAVIDWESWRPQWRINWGVRKVYRTESLKYAREKYPRLTAKQQARYAEKSFNQAAKHLMHFTLLLAKTLRPKAKWGYYGFPICYSAHGLSYSCSRVSQKMNKKLSWLYLSSTAFYPTIYMKTYNLLQSHKERHVWIQHRILEAYRYAAARGVAVYTYTKYAFDPYEESMTFYDQLDLCSTIRQSANLGLQGAIIWSSSASVSSKAKCKALAHYTHETMGPYISEVLQAAISCDQRFCGGHGRCVRTPEQDCTGETLGQTPAYCDCKPGWEGSNCQWQTKKLEYTLDEKS